MTRFALTTILGVALAVPAFSATPQAGDVEQMAKKIRKEILTLPNYGLFDEIRFTIEGNTVLLTGYASRPTLKSTAGNVVKDIAGVEKVRNEIEVLPVSRFDDSIRLRAYVAIYGDPVLERYNPNRGVPLPWSPARQAAGITNDPPPGNHPIHIIVNNGHVTLTGVVDNAADRQVAEARVNNVFGAMSVENRIEVARSK